MNLKVNSLEVSKLALTPTLNVSITCIHSIYSRPVLISGVLISQDGKECSYLHEYTLNGFQSSTIHPPRNDNQNNIKAQTEFILTGTITSKAIDYIEELREKDHEKSVRLSLGFIIKTLSIPQQVGNSLHIEVSRLTDNITIGQSDWERKYAAPLGIGKYMLLEFQIPEEDKVDAEWIDLYNRLSEAIREIEKSINHGDWKKALIESRIFFDNLYINKKTEGYESFKKKINDLFINDQHDDEGVNNFLNGIENFFNFYSKFVHTTNKKKEPKPLPIPTKEDAYFGYILAIGILNIIGKKASRE